jgi:predicted AAA+ superfamily ATPase
MAIEHQPAWNTHLRSSAELRKTPKRHFADPSMAVSVLGVGMESLINDPEYFGFLFESLAVHELRVYADANDAKVYHYRDSNDKEIDAIVQHRSGAWAAFEVKLSPSAADEAAANLLKIVPKISKAPASVNVITGTGATYTRPDGVNVISIASLGA